MTRISPPLSLLFAITLITAGCASTPHAVTGTNATVTMTVDCNELETEIVKTAAEKRAAREKEQGAWKAVVPFVVMARYIGGKTASETADRQLGELQAEFNRRGCVRHGI